MTIRPIEYQFDYEGEFETLDTVTILNAHLNFVNLIVQVKNEVAPESKLNIGLKGFKKGSLEVQHVIDIVVPTGMFIINNYDTIKKIFEVCTDLFKLKAFAGTDKFTHNEVGNNKVSINVNGNNNTIVIHGDAIKLYQNEPLVTKLMAEAGKNIDALPEIRSLELRPKDKKLPSLKLDREELLSFKEPNPYLEQEESDFYIYDAAVLYIRKADLNPKSGKKCVWQFVHKGRDISATIKDENFIAFLYKLSIKQSPCALGFAIFLFEFGQP